MRWTSILFWEGNKCPRPGSYIAFGRVEFMREKCHCRFIRRTCDTVNSELILSGMSVRGKCFKCSLFNMADEDPERRRTLILRKIVRQWNEKEKADNGAVCVAIFSGWIGSRMAKFLLFLWRDQIYACLTLCMY